jgi:hypothetical protein
LFEDEQSRRLVEDQRARPGWNARDAKARHRCQVVAHDAIIARRADGPDHRVYIVR